MHECFYDIYEDFHQGFVLVDRTPPIQHGQDVLQPRRTFHSNRQIQRHKF